MPRKNPDYGALLAAGLLGVGAGLLAAAAAKSSNESRREQFHARLALALAQHRLQLVSATLGRLGRGQAFWDVAVQDQRGEFWSARVNLALGIDPYADDAQESALSPFVHANLAIAP